jgi:lysophospholipase L1-like esterase
MGIFAVGTLPPRGTPNLPRVLAGMLPLQLQGATGYPCSQTQAPCIEYDADITANVDQLVADGLYLQLFDSARYMTGTSADMADDVHLNALGHQEVFRAIQDVLQ